MGMVSLAEFLHLTKLSTGDLFQMLEHGELPVEVGPTREVLIDLDRVRSEDVARRSSSSANSKELPGIDLLEEAMATEISHALDDMIDEAFELAMSWLAKKGDVAERE